MFSTENGKYDTEIRRYFRIAKEAFQKQAKYKEIEKMLETSTDLSCNISPECIKRKYLKQQCRSTDGG